MDEDDLTPLVTSVHFCRADGTTARTNGDFRAVVSLLSSQR